MATRTQSNGICVNLFFHFDLLHHHHFGLMVDFSVRSMAAIVISTQCTVMEPSTLHRISLHTKKTEENKFAVAMQFLCAYFSLSSSHYLPKQITLVSFSVSPTITMAH